MARRIKFNRINGKDTLSDSITTLNQNFELLEETLDTQIANGVSSLQVDDVVWNVTGTTGPSSTIKLSNGNTAKINPIPTADENQSGVITTGDQNISGMKTFKSGISTDNLIDSMYHNIITTDGNKVYVGGENGIQLIYDSEGRLSDVYYSFLRGTDISEIITSSGRDVEELRNYLESILNQYNTRLEQQEDYINDVARAIAEINNLDDLIEQLDGLIENYFGEPDEMQNLIDTWTDDDALDLHLGDTFTDIVNKKCYKLRKHGSAYTWDELDESEYSAVVRALINSLEAKSVADGKCTTFYQDNIPAPCYVGDIWIVKKAFYINGNTQVEYIEGTTNVPSTTIVYPKETMLFCVQDNDTNVPDITVWNKDLSTYSEIQFKKNVETRFGETFEAIEKAQSDIDAINDDNMFSVFEKRDFLSKTWYVISGSYNYNENADIEYDSDNRPTENPQNGFLGTSMNGSFWNAVLNCIGDNTNIDAYNVPLGELITAFKNLAAFCKLNGLFNNTIESTTFVTTRTNELNSDNSNIGAVAKKELADLLYNYYREEEECRKSSYISAVTSTLDDLISQEDHAIQNWYVNGVPDRQTELPWRITGESNLDETDNRHINDTLVDLNSTLGQNIYKFSKFTSENDFQNEELFDTQKDRRILNTSFYWKNIKSSDISSIINELDIDSIIAGMDGSINVFNCIPHDYTYGDIWFFNGFDENDPNIDFVTNSDRQRFIEGCIYYCNNTDLTGSGSDTIRENFDSSDWENGYKKGDEFITRFSNMASDSVLTPIEKNQLVRAWYEIAGVNLFGNDGNANDNILEDIFNDDNSNDGSFRFVINECASALGTPITSFVDFQDFISTSENSDSDINDAIEVVNNLVKKFKDIETALILCGCLDTSVDTILRDVEFSGFVNLTRYNGVWNQSVHINMLSDVFATYYMEEDNLKTLVHQLKINELEDELTSRINSIGDMSRLAKEAADAALEGIGDINSDGVFSVSEKMSFLNNTWRKIAGSKTYLPYNNAVYGNGKPIAGYLGTTQQGTFWLAIENMRVSPEPQIVTKFKTLGDICNNFGLFDQSLSSSNFTVENSKDALYDALFEYYNEEELLRKSAYAASVNEVLDNLKSQLDGKINTYYGDGVPPSTPEGLSELWSDSYDNHINDEYKNTQDFSTLYIFRKITDDTEIDENVDIQIEETGYYWKSIDTSNISNIISEFEDAYNEALAAVDGIIQIFGESDLPDEYGYGDIWFFGGISKINDNIENADLSSFVEGNIYYCNAIPPTGDSDDLKWHEFNPSHWTVGSNSGEMTHKLAHMTSDDWLSVVEKQQLLDMWYEITGKRFSEFGSNPENVTSTIMSMQSNSGSYYTLIRQYENTLDEYQEYNGGDSESSDTPGGEIPQPEEDYSVVVENAIIMCGGVEMTENIKIICEKSENENYFSHIRLDSMEPYYIIGYDDGTLHFSDNNFEFSVTKDTDIHILYVLGISVVDENNENVENFGEFGITSENQGDMKSIDITFTQDEQTYIPVSYFIGNDEYTIEEGGDIHLDIGLGSIEDYGKLIINTNGNGASLEIETTKTNLDNALKNIFTILLAVGCGENTLIDTDLKLVDIPSSLNAYGVGKISSKPTIIADIFNRYYAEAENLSVELTELQITTSLTNPTTVQELAEGIGGKGFILSSLIQLEYNDEVVGGLDGVTANNDNVGMWFGGTVENALKTLNGTLGNNEQPVPVIVTKNGLGSKIGPFKIGESRSNEHVFVGDETSGNVTVINTDYISMGASYSDSDTKNEAKNNATLYLDRDGIGSKVGPLKIGSNNQIFIGNETSGNVTVIDTGYISMGAEYNDSNTKINAKNSPIFLDVNGVGSKIGPLKIGSSRQIYTGDENTGNVTVIDTGYISMGASYSDSETKSDARENAIIFLDSNGDGSRIGPLKIKKDSDNNILTFGQSKPVFKYKKRVSDSNYHRQLCSVSSDTSIDNHTFNSTDLNKEIQYGTDAVDWETIGGNTHDVEQDIDNDAGNTDTNN